MIDKKDFKKLAEKIVSAFKLHQRSPSDSRRSMAYVEQILNSFDVESNAIVEECDKNAKEHVKEVRNKHRVVMRKKMPLVQETKLMEALEKRINVRQLHLGPRGRQEDETPEQMAKLDEEFEKLDIKYFSEMELVINYVRKKLGQEDFSYLGKCKSNELEESVNNLLPTLSKKSIKEIVKELQSRKDRPELWPREANDVLLVPQINKLILFYGSNHLFELPSELT